MVTTLCLKVKRNRPIALPRLIRNQLTARPASIDASHKFGLGNEHLRRGEYSDFGCVEILEGEFGHLGQHPANDRLGDADADDVAASQFFEK